VERLVKERLVGAAVLLAAAVILIPEMLSGPKHEESAQSAVPAEDAPTKTYTIDLGQSAERPSASPAPSQVETTAAPPSEMAPLPSTTAAPQATPESTVPQTEAKREEPPAPSAKPVAQPQPDSPKAGAVTAPSPRNESAEPIVAAPKPASVASERTVPTSKGWAVQLGSFSKADSAERLAAQVRSKGHNAFVMPVKSGSGTLYRVRVGPLKDRSAADALQRELKGESPNAAVVPHP